MSPAYSIDQWQRNFVAAYATPAPIDPPAGRQAIAGTFKQIDAKLTEQQHTLSRVSTGCGLSDHTQVTCSCGWKGPQRFEHEDDKCVQLLADESGHACKAGGAA